MSIKNILQKLNSRDTRLFPKLPKINKKIKFASILIAFVFLGFIGHQILAATYTIDKTSAIDEFKNKQSAMSDGNNQESWMNEAAGSNLMVVTNALAGTIPDTVLEGDASSWIPSGIIGVTNNAIASLYNPPFSGVQYIAQTVDNFLGKPVYATTGYQGLSALLPLWKGFRNVTYTIFSIIFIGIGIAIMLRIKISQNAVITIQSAIPKLVTSLILVTFSYAIVGLLIDLSYLIETLGISLIYTASNNSDSVISVIQDPNVYGKIFDLVPIAGITIISGIIAVLVAILSGGTLLIASIIGFLIVIAVLLIVILIYTVKFFFGLLTCYIKILLGTIFAPLEIAIGAIPNMKMGFGSWFINIIANLLVFPISMIFLVTAKTLMDIAANNPNLWAPTGLEIFSGGKLLSIAIGLSALMLVSKLPKMIPEFIFQIKPSPWGKAIGESFAPYGKFAKGTITSTGKAGVDYADQRTGDMNSTKWQKAVSITNRILGGKNYRKNVDKDSTTQDDEVL